MQSQPIAKDYAPVCFPDAERAVAWSDEVLSKPGTVDHIGKLTKRGGGDLPFEDVKAYALTVSAVVARTNPVSAGHVFRVVYGDFLLTDKDAMVLDITGKIAKMKEAKFTAFNKLRKLAAVAIVAAQYEQNTAGKYPRARIAEAIGIKRQSSYDKPWKVLIPEAQKVVAGLIETASAQIRGELEQKGMIY